MTMRVMRAVVFVLILCVLAAPWAAAEPTIEVAGLPDYGVAGRPISAEVRLTGAQGAAELTLNGVTLPLAAGDAAIRVSLPTDEGADRFTLTASVSDETGAQSAAEYTLPLVSARVAPPEPVQATGDWPVDLLVAALGELGYVPDADNTIVDAGGAKLKYTKYGAWFGSPYGAYDCAFVAYCLEAAGIGEDELPRAATAADWIGVLGDLYRPAGEYEPKHGDLVFFLRDWQAGPMARVGIVTHVWDETISAIEGTSAGVVDKSYRRTSPRIAGYVDMTEACALSRAEADAEAAEAGGEAEAEAAEADIPAAYWENMTVNTRYDGVPLRDAPGGAVTYMIPKAGTALELTGRAGVIDGVAWYMAEAAGCQGVVRFDALDIDVPPEPHYGRTLGRNVTVRAEMDTESELLAQYDESGVVLQVTDRLRGPDKYVWFQVVVDGALGYIRGDLFEPFKESGEAMAQEAIAPDRELYAQYGAMGVVLTYRDAALVPEEAQLVLAPDGEALAASVVVDGATAPAPEGLTSVELVRPDLIFED